MAVVFQTKKPKNLRTKKITHDDEEEGEETVSVSEILKEAREEQKYRQRQKGVSAVGLALGEMPAEKIVAPSEEDEWSLQKGGLVPKNKAGLDRNRDREGEDKEDKVSRALNSTFAAEKNEKSLDYAMAKYVEDKMAERKNQMPSRRLSDEEPRVSDYERMEQSLYQVPDHLNVKSAQNSKSGMLSNQVLSGIPEVDLGIDAKIRNIEATEAARKKNVADKILGKSNDRPAFAKERFFAGSSNHGGHKHGAPQVDANLRSFELAKRAAFLKGHTDHVVYSQNPDEEHAAAKTAEKRKLQKKGMANDDIEFDKFKKRARRF